MDTLQAPPLTETVFCQWGGVVPADSAVVPAEPYVRPHAKQASPYCVCSCVGDCWNPG